MAHIALIENGIVREVHVLNNDDLTNGGEFSPETEAAAVTLQHSLGLTGDWKLTSYNNNFRGQYAGQGMTYYPVLDEFVSPVVEP
jgi:hypothetical protein